MLLFSYQRLLDVSLNGLFIAIQCLLVFFIVVFRVMHTAYRHKPDFSVVMCLSRQVDSIVSHLRGQWPLVIPGRVAQSVTCLATDASLTADPGVVSSIPARSHTFVEIDHEIISTVILLPSAELFKKGCCQLQAKVCARSTG